MQIIEKECKELKRNDKNVNRKIAASKSVFIYIKRFCTNYHKNDKKLSVKWVVKLS